jgi:hypothetical protein
MCESSWGSGVECGVSRAKGSGDADVCGASSCSIDESCESCVSRESDWIEFEIRIARGSNSASLEARDSSWAIFYLLLELGLSGTDSSSE